MNFEKEIKDNIVIEKVNLTRATYKEAKSSVILFRMIYEAGGKE